MRRIYKGEKRYVGIEISRETETDFTVDAASYSVVNDEFEAVGDEGSAQVAEHQVFCLLDTTQECYEIGSVYWVYFKATIVGLDNEIIGRVQVEIEDAAEFTEGS